MAKTTVNLNMDMFRRSLKTTLPQLQALGAANIQRKFDAAKRESLEFIDNHPVTSDLRGSSFNIEKSSPIIQGSSAYANLFNVMGFVEGQDPISDLREFIQYEAFDFDKGMVKSSQIGNSRVVLNYFLTFASLKDTDSYGEFLLEWNEKSWLRLIEEGINNVEFFLQKTEYGRSKGGIQLPHKINDMAKFVPQKYYSEMIRVFLKRFSL